MIRTVCRCQSLGWDRKKDSQAIEKEDPRIALHLCVSLWKSRMALVQRQNPRPKRDQPQRQNLPVKEKIILFKVMSTCTAPTFVQSAGAVSRLGPTWWSTCTCISQTQPCSAPTASTTSQAKASYASTCFERPARSCTTATCVSTEQWSATPFGDTSPVCMETRQEGNTTQTSTPAQLVETPSNRARCSRPT